MLSQIHPEASATAWGELAKALPGLPLAGRLWGSVGGRQVELFLSTLATHREPSLLVLFPSFRVPALDGSGSNYVEEMNDRLETLDQFSDEHENISLLFAEAHPLTMDGEGRIVLPEPLKEHANITTDVAFVGLGAMFQMWEPRLYAEHRSAVRERSRQQRTTLPARGATARRPS
jgi:MraZ protein